MSDLGFTPIGSESPCALLLVDMQKGMAQTTLPPRNNPQAEGQIARLLHAWRAAKHPVVHIRHLSRSPGSPFWPGQVGAEFQDALAPLAHEHVVDKHVTDAFTQSGLAHWLHQRSIGRLVIVGVSTNYSVEATARSAGCLGFAVSVVGDATFTFARANLNGEMVSAQAIHDMALANLQGEYAQVLSTAEVLAAQ